MKRLSNEGRMRSSVSRVKGMSEDSVARRATGLPSDTRTRASQEETGAVVGRSK